MAPELARPVRRATFALLVLAAAAVEIAAVDTRPVAASLGLAAIWVSVAALLSWAIPVPADPSRRPPAWLFPLMLALAAAPLAIEPLRRDWTGGGSALELQMVYGLRNVGLGLAACGGSVVCLRLAAVVSLFLTLFAAAMTNHPAVMAILGLYTAVGSAWLMLVYWTGLRGVLVAPESAASVELLPERVRLPWVGLLVLLLAVGGGLALAVVGPKRTSIAPGEFMPTSGGTGGTDTFARYGVGDGPEEVAGDDAKAAGMVETEKMIEDTKDSLIDAVSDLYGPPHKPQTNVDRMVAAGLVEVIQNHGKLPDNRRPSRDFDTGRKGPKSQKTPDSQSARGVFEVEGRTPLHVRLVAYDGYDAANHRWVEGRKPASKGVEAEGGDWMRVDRSRSPADWYREDDRHRLKVADLKTNLVPTPAMLTRLRIKRVDKPDYYEWDYDGVLALANRRKTPPGVVVTTDCRTLDPAGLPASAFARTGVAGGTAPELGAVPETLRPEIERLARAWAGDRERGWPQVDAVLGRLRADYAPDRAAAPPGHPAPVLWFLAESRRGPDYLFATSAALLLRSLDYPTRVCLGYYADPDAYDPATAHTPVRATDLHTWAEVRLRDGQWLVVEPTPGYATLGPKRSLAERAGEALITLAAWARRHAFAVASALATLVAVGIFRRDLTDAVAVRLCLWWPGRPWRERVRRSVRVLERRGRWAGRPRMARQTPCSWLRGAPLVGARPDADFDRLTRMAEWAAYAPEVPPPWTDADVRAVCRRVLDGWTLNRWRDALRTDPKLGA